MTIYPQVVHLRIRSSQDSKCFLCSIAYASPHHTKRMELWPLLSSLADSVEGPWIIIGDFNCILDSSERTEGASRSHVGCKWFCDFLFDNALHDLGACGAQFT